MMSVIGILHALFLAGTVALAVPANAAGEQSARPHDCWTGDTGVLFASCRSGYAARVVFKQAGESWSPGNDPPDLLVSGTYTSTDLKVMGMAIDAGNVINTRANGWDGAVLIDAKGQFQLGPIDNLPFEGRRYALHSSKDDRKAFLARIAAARNRGEPVSLIQSHLLVSDGKVDVSQQDDAPAFRRRMLIETLDGHFLILDSGVTALTLFDAAVLASRAYHARHAINLDMGTYDYCLRKNEDGRPMHCGFLPTTDRLTNLISITRTP